MPFILILSKLVTSLVWPPLTCIYVCILECHSWNCLGTSTRGNVEEDTFIRLHIFECIHNMRHTHSTAYTILACELVNDEVTRWLTLTRRRDVAINTKTSFVTIATTMCSRYFEIDDGHSNLFEIPLTRVDAFVFGSKNCVKIGFEILYFSLGKTSKMPDDTQRLANSLVV